MGRAIAIGDKVEWVDGLSKSKRKMTGVVEQADDGSGFLGIRTRPNELWTAKKRGRKWYAFRTDRDWLDPLRRVRDAAT